MRNHKRLDGALRALFTGSLPAPTFALRCLFCLAAGLALFGGGYFLGQRQSAGHDPAGSRVMAATRQSSQPAPEAAAQADHQPAPEAAAQADHQPAAQPDAPEGLSGQATVAAPPSATAPGGARASDAGRDLAGPTLAQQKPATAPADPGEAGEAGAAADPDAPGESGATRASRDTAAVVRGQAPEHVARHPFVRDNAPFMLHKLGNGAGPTLLVIGGIQGDEPGGFSAAALLASHYRILSGNVWVVPDLNFPSILRRHRGIFGDMNRKFAAIAPDDPEFATIAAIKAVLLNEQVDLILNLHDGSGFYRPTWEDGLRNPKRWGQSVIIDQEEMEAPSFNMLFETAGFVESEVNRALLDPAHRYHTYNTLTAEGNKEMIKTLSWFAVRNGKPAFGIEASKEFSTEYRAYYHLNVIEAFMRRMDIAFERDFALSPTGVTRALNSGLTLTAFEGRLLLELDDVRPALNHVPFKNKAAPAERASKPLLALVPDEKYGNWRVAYGNRTLTRLNPDYMEFDDSLAHVDLLVDGSAKRVAVGEVVTVARSFLVRELDGYRVNAIGAQKEVRGTEAGVLLQKDDFMPRFSVDKKATLFRVEIYKGKAFAGMLLVRFSDGAQPPGPVLPADKPLTADQGRESDLGW